MKSYDDRNSYNNHNYDDVNDDAAYHDDDDAAYDDDDDYTGICNNVDVDVDVELPLNLFHHFNIDTCNVKKSSLLDHTYHQSSITNNNTKTNNNNNYNNNNNNNNHKTTTTTIRFNWETPIIQKDGIIVNKPILFHNQIKSSGYGQVPNDLYERKKLLLAAKKKKQLQQQQQQQKQKLQQQRQRQQQDLKQRQEQEQILFKDNDNDMDVKNMRSLSAPPSRIFNDDHNFNYDYNVHHDNTINNNINMNNNDHEKSSTSPVVVGSKGPRIRQYPTDSPLIDTYMHGHDYPYHSPSSIPKSSLSLSSTQLPPIQQIKYSDDGTLLGITTNDSVAIALKIPTSRFKGDAMSFVGNK